MLHSLILLAPVALGTVSLSRAQHVTILQPHIPIIPDQHLPSPNPAKNADRIVELFHTLGRTTKWDLVKKVHLEGPVGEPEGMVVLGDGERYFISAGVYSEPTVSFGGIIINGTDRTPGAGIAHLFVFDDKGTRIADSTLSAPGAIEYHTGGIDYDGTSFWGTIAQYRPNTTAHIVEIDPRTLRPTTRFHAKDHFGGIVHDTTDDTLIALNWGSRNASTWNLRSHGHIDANAVLRPASAVRNPQYWVDYQDCKFIGHPLAYGRRGVMLCSGVTSFANTRISGGSGAPLPGTTIGGVALVDVETLEPLAEVPIALVSDLGGLLTQNPVDVNVVNGKLRFYFCPDQNNATVYVIEANPRSPYEY